jgi:hypothetical protein
MVMVNSSPLILVVGFQAMKASPKGAAPNQRSLQAEETEK